MANTRGREAGPANNYLAVTPSDVANLPGGKARGLYVGVTGDVTVLSPTGAAGVAFVAVPAGTVLNVEVLRVYATGTDATDIVALY